MVEVAEVKTDIKLAGSLLGKVFDSQKTSRDLPKVELKLGGELRRYGQEVTKYKLFEPGKNSRTFELLELVEPRGAIENRNYQGEKTFLLSLIRHDVMTGRGGSLENYKDVLANDEVLTYLAKSALRTDIQELMFLQKGNWTGARELKIREYDRMLQDLSNPPTIPLEPTGN
jgi:hypothetical protein